MFLFYICCHLHPNNVIASIVLINFFSLNHQSFLHQDPSYFYFSFFQTFSISVSQTFIQNPLTFLYSISTSKSLAPSLVSQIFLFYFDHNYSSLPTYPSLSLSLSLSLCISFFLVLSLYLSLLSFFHKFSFSLSFSPRSLSPAFFPSLFFSFPFLSLTLFLSVFMPSLTFSIFL